MDISIVFANLFVRTHLLLPSIKVRIEKNNNKKNGVVRNTEKLTGQMKLGNPRIRLTSDQKIYLI